MLIAGGLLAGVYLYFSPSSGVAEVVAAESADASHSAAFVKRVPAKPVTQRLAQSPGPVRFGIISGHKGNDSGAVCDDGLTEAEVNQDIAARVVAALQAQGVTADLLDEFDPRLDNYAATGLVSIHADSCDYINDLATGFKVAGSSFTDSSHLSICIEDHYRQATQMNYHANTITPHMTDYHAFRKIARGMPAVIIEVGFMNLDREWLTQRSDVLAAAITDGIDCYLDEVRTGVSHYELTGTQPADDLLPDPTAVPAP
jgi:N-acetylmuramoyl-L-alanine amidase